MRTYGRLAPYRRVVENDSSGFEHVFVGEEKVRVRPHTLVAYVLIH
jgi:hypothetical protein